MNMICKLKVNTEIISLLDKKKMIVVSEKFADPYIFLGTDNILNMQDSCYFKFLIGIIDFIKERYEYVKFVDYDNDNKKFEQNIQLTMKYEDYAKINNNKKNDKIKVLAMGIAKVLGLFNQIVKKNVSIVFFLGKYATKKISHIKWIYDKIDIVDCDKSTDNCEVLSFKDIDPTNLEDKINNNIKIVSNKDKNNNQNSCNNNNNYNQEGSGSSSKDEEEEQDYHSNNQPNKRNRNKNFNSNNYNYNYRRRDYHHYKNGGYRNWYGSYYYNNNKYKNFNHNMKEVEIDYQNKSASDQQNEKKNINKEEQEDNGNNNLNHSYKHRPGDVEMEL